MLLFRLQMSSLFMFITCCLHVYVAFFQLQETVVRCRIYFVFEIKNTLLQVLI